MTMQSGVIAGASNAGLKDPGVHTAYSIGQLTALLVPEPVTAIDDLVILNVIIRLRKAAAKGFAKARKRLDLEHAEQRGFPTRRLYLDYLGTEFSKNLDSIRTEEDARHVNDPQEIAHCLVTGISPAPDLVLTLTDDIVVKLLIVGTSSIRPCTRPAEQIGLPPLKVDNYLG